MHGRRGRSARVPQVAGAAASSAASRGSCPAPARVRWIGAAAASCAAPRGGCPARASGPWDPLAGRRAGTARGLGSCCVKLRTKLRPLRPGASGPRGPLAGRRAAPAGRGLGVGPQVAQPPVPVAAPAEELAALYDRQAMVLGDRHLGTPPRRSAPGVARPATHAPVPAGACSPRERWPGCGCWRGYDSSLVCTRMQGALNPQTCAHVTARARPRQRCRGACRQCMR